MVYMPFFSSSARSRERARMDRSCNDYIPCHSDKVKAFRKKFFDCSCFAASSFRSGRAGNFVFRFRWLKRSKNKANTKVSASAY